MAKRKKTITILVILVLIVAIRLALPYVVLNLANKSLSNMKGYRGHIEDIDLSLIQGAYKIDSIYINKLDSATQKETQFFSASIIDLSIEWKALIKGSLAGEITVDKPNLRFTKDKVEPSDVRKDSSSFKQLLDGFMPLKINNVEIKEGRLQYIDENATPPVDISMTHAHIVAENLINSYDSTTLLPATVNAKTSIYDGTLDVHLRLNPLAKEPTFDLNAELKNTNLVKLNDFFQAYANVDVNKGTFGLYTEVAAKGGRFNGYVKPLIKDLDVLGKEDKRDNIFRKLWEGFVGTASELLENQPNDRVATKIPLQGDIKNPKANIWIAISEVIQNAFIQALQPAIDQQININTVDSGKQKEKNFIQKIFGKKDKDEKKK